LAASVLMWEAVVVEVERRMVRRTEKVRSGLRLREALLGALYWVLAHPQTMMGEEAAGGEAAVSVPWQLEASVPRLVVAVAAAALVV
jgi:hypothetical protein